MLTFKQAQKYVPKPPNRSIETYENGDTQDIIETMLFAEKREQEQRFLKNLAPLLRGRSDAETCKNIFDFVRSGLRYIADPRGHEKVKSSRWSIYYGSTIGLDCKSYSILICSLLRECGIQYKYRFVSWVQGRDVSHVYPIALIEKSSFEFPIAMDAIPESCGYNCEIRYAYKKDYDVTKISYIDGVNAQSDSSNIPAQAPLNWVSLTDGEAAISLAKDRLKLLLAAHPDSSSAPVWRKAITWIDNAMYRGLHSGTTALPYGLFASKEEQGIINFIKTAQKRFSPAVGDAFALIGRIQAWQGIKELGHVGDITLEDCGKLCTYKEFDGTEYVDIIDSACVLKCDERNNLARELMKVATNSGHHFLYEYMSDAQVALLRPTTQYKYDNHTQVLSKMAEIAAITRSNVREAFKTEIMRANAKTEIGAMTPEDSIDELIKEYNLSFNEIYTQYPNGKIQGIGFPLPIAFWIIMACVAAIVAIGGVIQIIQGKEPTAFDRLAGFVKAIIKPDGSTMWSPEGIDFKNTTGTNTCPTGYHKDAATGQCVPDKKPNTSTGNSMILPVAAGGLLFAGLTMGSGKKKKKK